MKVISFTNPITNLCDFTSWYIEKKLVSVEECKKHGNILLAKLVNCDDRDQALLFHNKEIYILRDQLPVLEQNTYYWSDLEGLQVFNTQGILLGTVDYLFETGDNDVLVLKNASNKISYVPFLINQTIKKVDLVERVIEVEWDADF